MDNLTLFNNRIPGMPESSIQAVRGLEEFLLTHPQSSIDTEHSIHAGVYTRTVLLPKGTIITGALIKRSTNLILHGHCIVTLGSHTVEYTGYATLHASANRKQGFHALEDTYLTMFFSTTVGTVEEAEEEFTDEAHKLLSRNPTQNNRVTITGE